MKKHLSSSPTKKEILKIVKTDEAIGPHQNIYMSSYHWNDVSKSNFFHSAVLIQRWWRQWQGEMTMKRLKMKEDFAALTEEYEEFCEKVLKNLKVEEGVEINPTLKNVEEYWDWKKKLSVLFDSLVSSTGSSMLTRDKFYEFFKKARIFATETEIDRAVKISFKGCSSRARIIFLPVHVTLAKYSDSKPMSKHRNMPNEGNNITSRDRDKLRLMNKPDNICRNGQYTKSSSRGVEPNESTPSIEKSKILPQVTEVLSSLYVELRRSAGYSSHAKYACLSADGALLFACNETPSFGRLLRGEVDLEKFKVECLKETIRKIQADDNVCNGNDVAVIVMLGSRSAVDKERLNWLRSNLLKLADDLEENSGLVVYLSWSDLTDEETNNSTDNNLTNNEKINPSFNDNNNETNNDNHENRVNMIELDERRYIYKLTPDVRYNVKFLASDIQRMVCGGACPFCRTQTTEKGRQNKFWKIFNDVKNCSENDEDDDGEDGDDIENINDDDNIDESSEGDDDCDDDDVSESSREDEGDGEYDNSSDYDDYDDYNGYDGQFGNRNNQKNNRNIMSSLKLGLTKEELFELASILKVPKFISDQFAGNILKSSADLKSTWMRPTVGGTAVCSWQDFRVKMSELDTSIGSQFLTCLQIVFTSKLQREKFVHLPILASKAESPAAVEKVTAVGRAMHLAVEFIQACNRSNLK